MRGLIGLVLLGLLACTTGPEEDALRVVVSDAVVRIELDDRPVLEYQLREQLPGPSDGDTLPAYYTRSGFIHPVYSPAGRLVTDDFPAGHTHQHGIFTAWTSTTFRGEHLDFWNQHQGTGTARHVELLETIDSTGVAGFRARLEQVSLQHGPVLEEEWYVRVYDKTDPYVWDLRTVQTNVTDDTLYLDQYHYGGLGVRGSAGWNEVDSVAFAGDFSVHTAEGITDRDAANHTRPAWTALYGPVAAKEGAATAGLAVFPHPHDDRGPHFVRVHPDMPYLSLTPVVEQGIALPPGGTFRARYRFVVFDGTPDPTRLDRYGWEAFRPG